jgi:NurA domain
LAETTPETTPTADHFLHDLPSYSDVYSALASNSALIATDIRKNYIPETVSIIKTFSEKCLAQKPTRFKFFSKTNLLEGGKTSNELTKQLLQSMNGRNVAAIDAGLGSNLMGSVVPFMMRSVTYSVRIGDKSPERESFSPSYFYMNRLTTGALGMEGDLLGAILLLFELTSAYKSLRQGSYDLFLMHGPLVRSLGQYSNYELSASDIKTIFDDSKLFDEFLAYTKQKNEEVIIKEGARTLEKDYRFFSSIAFVLNKIFEVSKEKSTTICGVVERTSSTEILHRVIFDDFDEIYAANKSWMEKAVGFPLNKMDGLDIIRYTKAFLDNLGYTDQLILGSILGPGEYLHPIESRVNRSQEENRKLGLDTGFISGMSEMEKVIPRAKFTYVRTSEFNSPFKVEFPYDTPSDKFEYLMKAVYAFSQFLPQYSFPINLDVVDKVAKVQNWVSNAMYSMILNEIYESYSQDKQNAGLGLLLAGKGRDWDLRPGVRRRVV